MNRILITGATGNIGLEVIHYLCKLDQKSEIIAGVRDVERAKNKLPRFLNLTSRQFNFEDERTFNHAFKGIDILFLLRPPHISDVEKYFKPLLKAAQKSKIQKVVFLSVQGVETSTIIPHHKIESLIKSMDFSYIFIRPSYFMQNLTTTLRSELIKNHTITLPSGKAKFNWVDTQNIGEATAATLYKFEEYKNNAYEITGDENKSFGAVTALMTQITGVNFTFKSINPISFYLKKKNEGIPSAFAIVMTILHFLPRFQKEPNISNSYFELTNKKPTTLTEFITREKSKFL